MFFATFALSFLLKSGVFRGAAILLFSVEFLL